MRTLNENFNFFAEKYEDGVIAIRGFHSDDTADKFFTAVSKVICFSDCAPSNVIEIYWHGERVWYDGWHPGMLFRYCNMYKEVVWEGCCPEWDH